MRGSRAVDVKVLLVLPIIIPLATAAICYLTWQWRRVQRFVGIVGAIALFAAGSALLAVVWKSGIQSVQMGGWPAPYGITFVADLLSALMVALNGLMGLAVTVYSLSSMDPGRESHGYYPLFHILLMGVSGAFLTGDIFNLYVWFEVLLIASFVLMSLGGERAQIEGGLKYVTLNLVSSALFLAALGILYGEAGTLNMADLAVTLRESGQTGLVDTLAVLFLVAFGIKAAIFPLFFWLPASYHTPPAAVSAIFSGLLTKVGVYALIRVFTMLFVRDVEYTHSLILWTAGLTMVIGILGAVIQDDVRRLLSFNIVSHIGYMIMGLGLFSPLGLAGSIFYIVHHIVVITNLFLISGLILHLRGSCNLTRLGGLYVARPALAFLFMIPALSLAGIPPLSGFFPKLALVRAGLESEQYWLVAAALAVGLLTLYSVIKVWNEAFWRADPGTSEELSLEGPRAGEPEATNTPLWGHLAPICVLALITVLLGLGAEPVFDLATRAAEQLLNPEAYIQTVLGGGT
jgi:multicomponent Na+:H+ antiporter subunit D